MVHHNVNSMLIKIKAKNANDLNLLAIDQVINSDAEDSDDTTDRDEDEDEDEDEEEAQILGPLTTLTARPPMDIEELAR